MKTKLTQAARKERFKKSVKVRRAWEQSGYEAVIKHFRDNKDLEFIGFAVIALRRVESQIIEDLMELDEEVLDEEIGSCVLKHLAEWTEHLGIMAKMLKESSDRAWEELEKIDSFNQESG
jgi:hypothetical protein